VRITVLATTSAHDVPPRVIVRMMDVEVNKTCGQHTASFEPNALEPVDYGFAHTG
jgi:hypothetical protein